MFYLLSWLRWLLVVKQAVAEGFFPLLITLAADLISQVASMSPYYGLGCYDVCPKLMFVHGGMDDDAERVAC